MCEPQCESLCESAQCCRITRIVDAELQELQLAQLQQLTQRIESMLPAVSSSERAQLCRALLDHALKFVSGVHERGMRVTHGALYG